MRIDRGKRRLGGLGEQLAELAGLADVGVERLLGVVVLDFDRLAHGRDGEQRLGSGGHLLGPILAERQHFGVGCLETLGRGVAGGDPRLEGPLAERGELVKALGCGIELLLTVGQNLLVALGGGRLGAGGPFGGLGIDCHLDRSLPSVANCCIAA